MNRKLTAFVERIGAIPVDASARRRADAAQDAAGLDGETPLAVVAPRSVVEVQAVVAAAREARLKLLPMSSRGPHHRGDTRATVDTVVVDMSGFQNVVRVDRRNRVALFEAGVDFATLTKAVRSEGLKPLLPLAPRPGKSALAAYLEREPTIYPRYQWDHSDPLLCAEVVFGTGEHFRTGSSSGPGTLEEQWAAGDAQTNPMGPGQSDLMRVVQGAQGTIGIVSWCSVKTQPERNEQLYVLSASELEPLVRVAYGMFHRNHADICFIVNGAALASLGAQDRAAHQEGVKRAARWYLVYSLADAAYFPDDKRAFQRREIDALCRAHGAQNAEQLPVGDVNSLFARLTRPDLTAHMPYWRYAGLNRVREVMFQTTLDRADALVSTATGCVRSAAIAVSDVLVYIQPLVGGRTCHVELALPFRDGDELARKRIDALATELAATLKKKGAFFSRPYGPLADVAFEGSSSAWLLPKVKRIFDPDGILAPRNLVVPAASLLKGSPNAQQ